MLTHFARAPVDDLLPLLPRATPGCGEVVYLVQADDGGPVKVGHSTYPAVERRIGQLQTGNPSKLVVRGLFEGGMALEQLLHEVFADHRLVGEWFAVHDRMQRMCPEVVG